MIATAALKIIFIKQTVYKHTFKCTSNIHSFPIFLIFCSKIFLLKLTECVLCCNKTNRVANKLQLFHSFQVYCNFFQFEFSSVTFVSFATISSVYRFVLCCTKLVRSVQFVQNFLMDYTAKWCKSFFLLLEYRS